jgi:hypothetical protein
MKRAILLKRKMDSKIFFLSIFAAGILSACSSDNTGSSKATTTGNIEVGVSVPSVKTRVTETSNATSGLVTAWETTDKLNIWHKYLKAGSIASMISLEFQNSSSAGSSGTFRYTGTNGTAAGYSFNPSNKLYAFNELPTTSNFTQTYNTASDNFTLSLSGFGSQNGTATNLRNYDAMYGVSSVDASGTPSNTTMNHFTSVIRFDLTNTNLTTSNYLTSVTFTCGSTTTSILPTTGSFTLSNAGVITNGTLTGATSWTVSNIAASSGTASVYLMTFPFQGVSGTLSIAATALDGSTYFRNITLSSLSLTSGTVKAYTVSLLRIPDATLYTGKYYEWDATAVYPATYNTIISGVATNCCKNCPTLLQIQMYLGAGVIWDPSNKGLWLKKSGYISGFAAGTATTVAVATNVTPTTISSYSNSGGQYFFLPAAGVDFGGSVSNSGTVGYYWSSTPYSNSTNAYSLFFNSTSAFVYYNYSNRNYGFCLW